MVWGLGEKCRSHFLREMNDDDQKPTSESWNDHHQRTLNEQLHLSSRKEKIEILIDFLSNWYQVIHYLKLSSWKEKKWSSWKEIFTFSSLRELRFWNWYDHYNFDDLSFWTEAKKVLTRTKVSLKGQYLPLVKLLASEENQKKSRI